MAVHPIGCTGKEGDVVLSLLDLKGFLQCRHVVLVDHGQDLVHFIGKGLIQDVDVDPVALVKLVYIGKQPCAGQASVSCQHTVGAFSSDGKLRPV